tara:strand:+ start:2251 stop:2445 length:195 start_codon:yes stop_codon:yes gene_type:complete
MKIDNETDDLLPELLDEVRDKIVEKTGQNLDWKYHNDTNLEQIVIVWFVKTDHPDDYGFTGRLP